MRAAGLDESLAAACGGTCRRRGAAAHPPLPLEARYNPPRAAGIRDLTGGSESLGLRARLAGLDRVSAPQESPGVAGGANLGASCSKLLRLSFPPKLRVRRSEE